jgi:dolichol-phosphate mannosyltransferase
VLASALAWGLPAWLAVTLGLALAWGLRAAGEWRILMRLAAAPSGLRMPGAAGTLLLAIALLHLAYLKVFPLLPEEAYYWNYAARPDFGYLDHPPMVAWLIALAEALFGHGEAVVRLPALACGVVVAVFVWRLARRLVDPAGAWMAAALSVTLPYAFFVAGLLITPDAPLAAAWAAALYFLHRALVGGEGAGLGGRGRGAGRGHAVEVHDRAAGAGGAVVLPAGCACARLVFAPAALRGGAAGGAAVCAGGGVELLARLGVVPLPGAASALWSRRAFSSM